MKNQLTKSLAVGLFEVRKEEPLVSSLKIAEMFERNHRDVLRTLRRELAEEISQRKLAPSDYLDDRGKTQPCFQLNERQALFVMPFIGGRKAREGQRALVDGFFFYRDLFKNPPRVSLLTEKRSAHLPMMDALVEYREDLGKTTGMKDYANENRLCNWAVSGHWGPLDEKALSNEDTALLAKVRRSNESLLMVGMPYAERKDKLSNIVLRWKTKKLSSK